VIVASADSNVLFAGVTAAVAVTLLTTKLHPLWLLGAGAALGVLTALL
jgi:hypothetical protein